MMEDWVSKAQTGQVYLPEGYSLFLKACGPARTKSDAPVVVLVHGLGGSASEWLDVQRVVSDFARVYLYERSGYQGSDPSPNDPTPQSIAAELRALLQAAAIAPPYLLVGHSYGGVIVRQFLADYASTVSGMVLVDSVPVVNKFPTVWTKLLGNASYAEVVGLRANLSVNEKDYDSIEHESELNEQPGGIAERELGFIVPGNQRLYQYLQERQALGSGRLCVIWCDEARDFRRVYEHGVRHGYGTSDEQEIVRAHLETMSMDEEVAQRTQLALSSTARFVRAEGVRATHNVHMVDPSWVAQQIRWVFDGVERNLSAAT
ncbi:hypothetical protein B0A48_05167 [Cryoendolithus antarcticus]|uniref:AB hydrolase-1 domain-containing protein n=1 Tax=Cryoendolithus antarcticus TaxID=1507870 RepID=A0A1V8TEG2_9PEZI|nr:hypothetical protein B0A48_05167 [Cryoendolithus antarcticus]